jgi:methionyl-tRNA formyltransferase
LSQPRFKVVFMGSPDFALPSLEALVESGRYSPGLVVTQPDRQRGRGKRFQPTPVKARAVTLGIPVAEMTKGNYAREVARIASFGPDVVVVVAFGIIIGEDLLQLPRYGCVNVHASLLPKYRGVSPVQAAILAGDSVTGCSTMLIDAGVDTGDVLLQESTGVEPDDTAGTLSDRLSRLGAGLLVRTLDGLLDGTITPVPQDEALASYARKIKKSHGAVDWGSDAPAVERRIRAMTPWPSAYAFFDGGRLIIERAALAGGSYTAAAPGTVVSLQPLVVACGDGHLEIHRLKPEGKKSMTPEAFLAGHGLAVGDVLE